MSDTGPVVARVRLRYAKRGRLRFTSHRDFQRVLERAIRRAGVPIAYSSGFTPHPKISYAGAAPTGTASEAEYVELGLAEPVPPALLLERLAAALPAGLDLLEVVPAVTPNFAERLQASHWQVRLALPVATVQPAVERFLAAPRVEVERVTRDGRRVLDARAPVLAATVRPDPAEQHCAILDLVVQHVTPAVRPDDVLAALRLLAGLAPPEPPLVTRLAQGRLDDAGDIVDPLESDRGANGSVDVVGVPLHP